MLVPNFSVVKLARKAAYRTDGDLIAAGTGKPAKVRGRNTNKVAVAGSSAKSIAVRASKKL